MPADITLEKTLPCNLEAERAVLGYVLTSGIIDFRMDDEHFYLESHRKIMRAARELLEADVPPDIITIKNHLQRKDELEASGGPAYIASLTDGFPLFREGQVNYYADIVRQKAALRKMIQTANETMVRCYQDEEDFKEISSDVIGKIDLISADLEPEKGPVPIEPAVSEAYKQIEAIANYRGSGIKTGLSLGLREFDRMIPAGLQPDEMLLIAGRPGQGKTSLLLSILAEMADHGESVLFFSIEMGLSQIMQKLICLKAEVPLSKIRTGFLNREDWAKIGRAAGAISQWKFWIDDSTGITVADIHSRYRRLRQKITVIGLDYLQLIEAPKFMAKASQSDRAGHVSKHVKFLNRTLRIPFVFCAQLNRSSERRKDTKPQLSDLRESGQIEQDADTIAFVHRDESLEDNHAIADIIVAKQRNGPTGSFQLVFLSEYAKFANLWSEEGETSGRWYNRD